VTSSCSPETMLQTAADKRAAIGFAAAAAIGFIAGRATLGDRRRRKLAAKQAAGAATGGTTAQGEVFLYNESYGMAALEVGGCGSGEKALVCIGGLTDGLLSLRYMPMMAEVVARHGWRVVQPVLSSSYSGWGTASLDADAAEIDGLLEYLKEHRGLREFVILGHSTGCQDVVRYLQVGGKHVGDVKGAILQAPVSDREALQATGEGFSGDAAKALADFRERAAAMLAEGRGDEAMPRAASLLLGPPHVVTAYRFASLTGRMTDDDMFSSDLSDEELQQKLGHMSVPTLLAVSADDEYVPASVDCRKLVDRMARAMAADPLGRVEQLVIEQGGHSLRKSDGAAKFTEAVAGFLDRLATGPRLRWELEVAKDIKHRLEGMAPGRPLLVALAGMPGSGKTTATRALERLLGPSCLVAPMDGFHVPMAALRARPDADDAIYRRGAPDTFDPAALLKYLQAIRNAEGPDELTLPGFDHAVGDPTPGGVVFKRQTHKVVIVEGLYLLHDSDGFQAIKDVFDWSIYINTDIEVCVARVKERNKVIPGYTAAEIDVRTERVDRANAVIVQRSASRADRVVG